MSVLFNHACRYELFDRNPIYLVRQSAKRRRVPVVLLPAEIKALLEGLGLRDRTLVLLAASTGLRQSEIFGLKWGDIDFDQGAMSVTRSIVYGVVGPCKTESSQKPVPLHFAVAQCLMEWKTRSAYTKSEDWLFASRWQRGRKPIQVKRFCGSIFVRLPSAWVLKSNSDGIHSDTPIRLYCEVWERSSK
jgi:integrase